MIQRVIFYTTERKKDVYEEFSEMNTNLLSLETVIDIKEHKYRALGESSFTHIFTIWLLQFTLILGPCGLPCKSPQEFHRNSLSRPL